MEVFGTILLLIHIGDVCSRIWFDIVGDFALIVLFSTTYITKFINEILLMERRAVPLQSWAMAVLATDPILPPIMASVRNEAEPATTGASKKPQIAETDVHANCTNLLAKAKIKPPQSVEPIEVAAPTRGLVAVEPMSALENDAVVSLYVG